MGRPLTVLALLILFCLGLGGAPTPEVIGRVPKLTANFECQHRRIRPHDKLLKEPLPRGDVSPPVLTLTTVQSCPSSAECEPCIRLNITMDTSDLPRLQGFWVSLLELSTNNHEEFKILKKNKIRAQGVVLSSRTFSRSSWAVQYDCFKAAVGSTVSAQIYTIPDYNFTVQQDYVIEEEEFGLTFSHSLDEIKRQISITVPSGPEVNVRLCHQGILTCGALTNHSFQAINTSLSLSTILPYDFLVPCLCIEVFYLHHDSKRKKICPFNENPKAYGADLWNSGRYHDSSWMDKMVMTYKPLCPDVPLVSLCYKTKGHIASLCEDIPNSTVNSTPVESELVYSIGSVDRNPLLCFKFSLGNSSHVQCPHKTDTDWTVIAKVQLLHIVLTFTNSSLPLSASFSAVACRKSEDGQCRPAEPVYTITWAGSSKEKFELILPFEVRERCVLVWRSDVRFAVKDLICPDFSHRRLGLVAVALLAAVLLAIAALVVSYHAIRKTKEAPLWRRTILLLYSPDSDQYKIAICAFADFLRTGLGCDVILDIWDVGHVTKMGILPWLYSKKERVEREKGKVIIVWTQYSTKVYQLWSSKSNGSSSGRIDPHNLFDAAMSCLQTDLKKLVGKEKLRDYILVYFDGLCEKQNIPTALSRIPQYHLFKDLHGLVKALQLKAQGPQCWIWAAAKFLVRKLVKSDKSANLQGRLELCRLQQPDYYGWPKTIATTKMETSIY